MHSLFAQASAITHDCRGPAIEVHIDKGSRLAQSVYEWCLTIELGMRGTRSKTSQDIPVEEAKQTKAGARGVKGKGNAGAMGDPVSDQSQHNYQVSRDTDMEQHAEDAANSQGTDRQRTCEQNAQ